MNRTSKRRAGRVAAFAVLACLAFLPAVYGDSLWDRRDARAAPLFSDTRARQVGDLLTVVISESTSVNERDQVQLRKEAKAGGLFNFKGNTAAGKLARDATVNMESGGSANRRFDGSSDVQNNRRFGDRMTVAVVDVQPNGNLVVEGRRKRQIGWETRTLRLTGVVRPIDIGSGNTIQSQSIANFQIGYEGHGPETNFTTQGYLSRALNYLWPF